MGVRRLQTFLEKYCPSACRRVNIEDLANEYRDRTGKEPVIVIDGSSTYRSLYRDIDWICGGQCKEFAERVKDFLKVFQELEIQVVVFFDGRTQPYKRPLWVQRRLKNVEETISIMERVGKGDNVSTFERNYLGVPSIMANTMAEVAMEQNCRVFLSVLKDCDSEIVQYNQQHDCFAIMGQDTDFVIHEGDHLYLSAEKFCLEDISTLVYDRKALASALKISTDQLPILATIMGNDIIKFDDLKRFHMSITGRIQQDYPKALVNSLSAFIDCLPKDKRRILSDSPSFLSNVIFKTSSRAVDIKESIQAYYRDTSLRDGPYFGKGAWADTLEIAYKFHVENRIPYAFVVMWSHMYEIGCAVEDFSAEALTSVVVLRPMRQRMYGVLLKEQPLPVNRGIIDEWCVCGLSSCQSATEVEAIVPLESFLSLRELWLDTSDKIKLARRELLAWIISPHFPVQSLRQLPFQIVAAAAVLFYLYNDANVLEAWEVKAFAASVVDQQVMSSRDLRETDVPKLYKRGVHLATLFTRAITQLFLANAICGDPIPRQWVQGFRFFDGRLFQATYATLKKGSEHLQLKGSEDHYNQLCAVVFEQ